MWRVMHQVCSQDVQHTLACTDSVQYVHMCIHCTHTCELEMYGVLFDWFMCDAFTIYWHVLLLFVYMR